MTSIYGAIETISIRCHWLKTEIVDCQKMKTISTAIPTPPPCSSHTAHSITEMYKKYLDSILTSLSLWATPLALNCVRKSIAKKMTIAFFLFALNARGERDERWGRGAGRWQMEGALPTSLVTMTRTVCPERWEIWLQEKERKKKTSRGWEREREQRRASVIVFLCHTLANANRRALQRAQLQRILLPYVMFPSPSFFLFSMLTDRQILKACFCCPTWRVSEPAQPRPRRCDMTLGIIWPFSKIC